MAEVAQNIMKEIQYEPVLFDIQKAAEKIGNEGELKRIVTGYAAVAEVVDSQFEVISREALDEASKDLLQYTTVLYNHDPSRPIGKVLEAKPEGNGLFVKVMISASEDEIWDKITEGIISKFSFRGTVTDFEERYDKELQKYVTVIKAFRIVEVSLVSVPANPHAKTLHYYLSKALESYIQHQEKESPVSVMAGPDDQKEGGPKTAMDKEKAKLIAGLVDKLLAALQDMPNKVDERLLAICRKIKAEVMAAAGEGDAYPQPAPEEKDVLSYDPIMEGIKGRITSFEDKVAAIEKRLDELVPEIEQKLFDSIKGAAEQLVNDKIGEVEKELSANSEVVANFVELLDALRPHLGLPESREPEVKPIEGGET